MVVVQEKDSINFTEFLHIINESEKSLEELDGKVVMPTGKVHLFFYFFFKFYLFSKILDWNW